MESERQIFRLRKDAYETVGLPVGQGAYGVVWKARRVSDDETVALKTVQTRRDDGSDYGSGYFNKIIDVQKWEIAFLRGISTENAIKHHILPLLDDGQTDAIAVSGRPVKTPVMVFPFCRGNLSAYMRDRESRRFPFDMDTVLTWISKIAVALNYLHGLKTEDGVFVHRDLKFQNVLVNGDDLYLCDFGTVRARKTELTRTFAGTPLWAAPEMLIPPGSATGERQYKFGPKADIYGLGLMIFALITGTGTAAQRQSNDLITASGKPVPGASDKFGKIGGLTEKENEILIRELRRLMIDADKTLVPTDLPDIESVVKEFVLFVRSMLAPLAGDRPSAKDCIVCVNQIRDHLHPEIRSLTLSAPKKIELGRRCPVLISVDGQGTPFHANWLHVAINKRDVEGKRIKKTGPSAWDMEISVPQKTGRYTLLAYTIIDGVRVDSNEYTIAVTATPEQLWSSGLYADALILDPDRMPFLSELDAKAKKHAAFQKEYLHILEKVLEVHPKHEQINLRYWDLKIRTKAESRIGTPQKPSRLAEIVSGFPLMKACAFAFVLLLFFLGAYYIPFADISELFQNKPPAISVNTIEQHRQTAINAYHTIVQLVNKGQWEDARRRLTESRQNLNAYLDKKRKKNIKELAQFFEFIADGEQYSTKRPESEEILNMALKHYNNALVTANALPGDIVLAPTVEKRIAKIMTRRKALLLVEIRKRQADEMYYKIVSLVNSGNWEYAEREIKNNRTELNHYLKSIAKKAVINQLASFFMAFGKGRKAEAQRPITEKNLKKAVANYRDSLGKGRQLPAGIMVLKIVQTRIRDVEKKIEELQPYPSERFIAIGNVVMDTKTGLMWAAQDNGSNIIWEKAEQYCEDYTGGGYTDWRMPSLHELASLYDKQEPGYSPECANESWKIYITPLIKLTCCCPWAKEKKNDGSLAAYFDFDVGRRLWYNPGNDYFERVLPVRAGN